MNGKLWAVILLIGTIAGSGAVTAYSQTVPCNRACLEEMADRYVEALISRDPSMIPLADNVKYVENGISLKPGQGLWKTATAGLGVYRHYFADVQAGQVGLITTLQQNGRGQIFTLRLKLEDGKIAEAEHLVINDSFTAGYYDKFKMDPLWLQETPPDERVSRAELVATANKYYTGMQRNDPKGDYSFFHKDCNRFEHARQTTNMPPSNYGHSDNPNFVTLGCEDQFKTGFLGFVTKIRGRRFAVVDEERQAVLAFGFFDHNGTVRDIPLSTGENFHVPPYFSTPRTLIIAEGFKIQEGKIRLIEALLTESTYGMRSAFDPPLRTGPVPASCDRKCLNSLVDRVLAAMMAHDPSRAPLSAGVRYTENGQELALDDGLWGTLTKRGDYSLYLADEKGGQVGFLGSTIETDVPGMLTLRLKVEKGLVSEIEAISVRQEKPLNGKLIGTQTMMAPPWMTDFDFNGFSRPDSLIIEPLAAGENTPANQMIVAANSYLHGLQMGSSASVPITDDCRIRINGTQASDNPEAPAIDPKLPDFRPQSLGCAAQIDSGLFAAVSHLRRQRILLTDPEKGLVLTVAVIDHPADKLRIELPHVGAIDVPPSLRIPNTYLTTLLFKIRHGQIAGIERIERPAFYGIESGWPQ